MTTLLQEVASIQDELDHFEVIGNATLAEEHSARRLSDHAIDLFSHVESLLQLTGNLTRVINSGDPAELSEWSLELAEILPTLDEFRGSLDALRIKLSKFVGRLRVIADVAREIADVARKIDVIAIRLGVESNASFDLEEQVRCHDLATRGRDLLCDYDIAVAFLYKALNSALPAHHVGNAMAYLTSGKEPTEIGDRRAATSLD